ncbi:MAG TPA: DEAD/DEAH box helicase [Mucilaginibacter sp.]|jgi:SNF2 family DNA or RNA helicase
MSEKKSYKEKVDQLLEAFSELIKEDIEEAREVLRAAGKDPDKIVEKGVKQISVIRKKVIRAQKQSAGGRSAGEDALAFPVFLLDEDTGEVLLSDDSEGLRVLTADEIYALVTEHHVPEGSTVTSPDISEEVQNISFQRFLKEITFTIRMSENEAEVRTMLKGTPIELSYDALQLIFKTAYYLADNRCYPVDPEALSFSKWLVADISPEMTLPLHIALDLFSKRDEYKLLQFDQWSSDLTHIFTSGSYRINTGLFVKDLYPYQHDGVSWLTYCCLNRIGGILADDMGLGKTAQVIALIANIIERSILKNILIVVPGTLLENWRREFRFFAPELVPFIHHGSQRTGSADVLKKQPIVITSYSMIINDLYLFNKISWGLTILDEASLIKNPDAERRTALKVLPSGVRIAMTGTPVENSLTDLWSLADYVQPGYLGSKSDFTSRYAGKNSLDLANSGLARLRDDVSYIMLRRKKEDVLDNLPERIDIHQALLMHSSEVSGYESKRNEILSAATATGSGSHILQMITELRMFTTHPLLRNPAALADAGINELRQASFKFSRLLELLHEIAVKQEKVLIFTEFLDMIDTLKRVLPHLWPIEILTIDGRVETSERQANIDRFSAAGGFGIMVLNPKTAGMGLNITAANHVIHYTRQWNPALEEQASARSYRNGQKKAVNIYYLYYADTIEEVIDERLRNKTALSGEVITVTDTDNMEEYLNALQLSPLK